MLCHFCQNLVFVPAEEVSVQIVNCLLTTRWSYLFDPDKHLVSVHQPSREALEFSAGQGCRVFAMFWFQLFNDAGATHARRDNAPEVAPILLYMSQLSWERDFKLPFSSCRFMSLSWGERKVSLEIRNPVSGTMYVHM